MQNRTTFVIAHRLSTVRNATRVLVFENGRIVESGTFDDLLQIGGRLAALAKAQFMAPEIRIEIACRRFPWRLEGGGAAAPKRNLAFVCTYWLSLRRASR